MTGHFKRSMLVLASSLALAVPLATAAPAQAATLTIHVSGNQLVDGAGHRVQFRGVNLSGPEYACIQGWGIFDGPSDAASVQAMTAWHVNAVRVVLNEDCWLGINGVSAAYGGAAYQQAIQNYVSLLHQHGMYVELSLIWAAPGSDPATYQPAAPDADHSPSFWTSVASAFKNDPGVIFGVWGEPTVSWTCFLNGCADQATHGSLNSFYTTAGSQQLVNAIRATGAAQPIAVPCIDYANDCSDAYGNWLQYEPLDPLHQLVAEAHIYGKNSCSDTSCFNATLLPTAQVVPMIWGEAGESYDASDCGATVVSSNFPWAMAHTAGVEAWTWDTWGNCGVLIADDNGSPYGAFGQWVQSYYASLVPINRGRRSSWLAVPRRTATPTPAITIGSWLPRAATPNPAPSAATPNPAPSPTTRPSWLSRAVSPSP